MKTIAAILFGAIFIILFTTSCTQKPQEQILGEWQDAENMVWEFSEDGSLIFTRSGYGSKSASWAMSQDGKVVITYPDEREYAVTPKFLENGTLELDFEGEALSLTRLDSAGEDSDDTGINGKYVCQGVYDWLEFKDGGKVYISAAGMEIPATYEVDGDRISVTADGEGVVYTKRGDALDGGRLGTCSKN